STSRLSIGSLPQTSTPHPTDGVSNEPATACPAGGNRSASRMQEWMLALKENVRSPDYWERRTHSGAKRQALDLPTRWSRFYSPRADRQLHHSAAWKHGRANDLFVGA